MQDNTQDINLHNIYLKISLKSASRWKTGPKSEVMCDSEMFFYCSITMFSTVLLSLKIKQKAMSLLNFYTSLTALPSIFNSLPDFKTPPVLPGLLYHLCFSQNSVL